MSCHALLSSLQPRLQLLRPETMESLFLMWRFTKDPKYREWGWKVRSLRVCSLLSTPKLVPARAPHASSSHYLHLHSAIFALTVARAMHRCSPQVFMAFERNCKVETGGYVGHCLSAPMPVTTASVPPVPVATRSVPYLFMRLPSLIWSLLVRCSRSHFFTDMMTVGERLRYDHAWAAPVFNPFMGSYREQSTFSLACASSMCSSGLKNVNLDGTMHDNRDDTMQVCSRRFSMMHQQLLH